MSRLDGLDVFGVALGHHLDVEELGGRLTFRLIEEDGFDPPITVVIVEQDLGPGARYACWSPLPRRALMDDRLAIRVMALLQEGLDRHLRPWKQPDTPAMPTFTPRPTLATLGAHLGRLRRHLPPPPPMSTRERLDEAVEMERLLTQARALGFTEDQAAHLEAQAWRAAAAGVAPPEAMLLLIELAGAGFRPRPPQLLYEHAGLLAAHFRHLGRLILLDVVAALGAVLDRLARRFPR